MTNSQSVADVYNENYKKPNFFHYNQRLYEPLIASLVSFCKLRAGASVLDVGCGQGFFSCLLAKQGLRVHGVDLSETGIALAQQRCADLPLRFTVADILEATFPEPFDCVFVRSCSLYNIDGFPTQRTVTDRLLELLKPGGTLIFVYNSTFRLEPGAAWRHHSLAAMRKHFSSYPGARVFFVNKLLHLFWRRLSFTRIGTQCSAMMTRLLRKGGDFVCILEKRTTGHDSIRQQGHHTQVGMH
jgi:SAM-dependent methyltransferase